MSLQHVPATCLCNMSLQHVPATCLCNMFMQHVPATRPAASGHLYTLFVSWVISFYIRISRLSHDRFQVMGSNPVLGVNDLNIFQALISQLLKLCAQLRLSIILASHHSVQFKYMNFHIFTNIEVIISEIVKKAEILSRTCLFVGNKIHQDHVFKWNLFHHGKLL